MTVTVLQRKASTQQIGLLLVPAIKGAVYINTHCNYSQLELTKLYNENIGGHHFTFIVEALFVLSIVNLVYMLWASKISMSLFSVTLLYSFLVMFQRQWYWTSMSD